MFGFRSRRTRVLQVTHTLCSSSVFWSEIHGVTFRRLESLDTISASTNCTYSWTTTTDKVNLPYFIFLETQISKVRTEVGERLVHDSVLERLEVVVIYFTIVH